MDQRLLNTIELAKTNAIKGLPRMAATIYHRGKLRGQGFNHRKTHPWQKRYGKNPNALYLHAEIAAIRDFLRNHHVDELIGATMMVARVYRDNSPAMAKPCQGCQRAIAEFGLKVEWTVGPDDQLDF